MRAISVLAFDRPEYLEKCLDALALCRGIENYGVLVSVDGGSKSRVSHPSRLNCEVIYLKRNYGIDHHNKKCYNAVFNLTNDVDFLVALEDDAVLTPDALEVADWFYYSYSCATALGYMSEYMPKGQPPTDEYLFCSLGDPMYRGGAAWQNPAYFEIHETQSIYTSAWCFSRAAWQKMRPHWNRPLKTQLGWDWSLSYAMWENKWKALYPLVSRARNIGREGVHSHPEFFDANIAPAIASDGRHAPQFEITYRDPLATPAWIVGENAATEDRYAHLRNK